MAKLYREQLAFQRSECERLRTQLTDLASRGVVGLSTAAPQVVHDVPSHQQQPLQQQPPVSVQPTATSRPSATAVGSEAGASRAARTTTSETQTPIDTSTTAAQTDVTGGDLDQLVSAKVAADVARDAKAITEAHHRQIAALQGRVRTAERNLDLALAREERLRKQIQQLLAQESHLAAVATSFAAGAATRGEDGDTTHRDGGGGGEEVPGENGNGAKPQSQGRTRTTSAADSSAANDAASELLQKMRSRYEESVKQLRDVFTVRRPSVLLLWLWLWLQLLRVVAETVE